MALRTTEQLSAKPIEISRRRAAGRPQPIMPRGEASPLLDLYHRAMAMPLWGIIVSMGLVYLAVNLVFAGLYLVDAQGVDKLKPGDFWNAFFFSVETFGTIGYGYMSPISLYANVLMTAETFIGLVYVAVATGLVFARVSKPTARITFSRNVLVTSFEGKKTLMFRAANRRSNQILEAEVMLNLARDAVTSEGHTIRRFVELKPVKARSPLFAFTWSVMHVIDETSPLYGDTPETLDRDEAEIIVVLSGVDDGFSQRVHARYSYNAEEIVFGKRFADVLTVRPDGSRAIDYRLFHHLVDAPPAKID